MSVRIDSRLGLGAEDVLVPVAIVDPTKWKIPAPGTVKTLLVSVGPNPVAREVTFSSITVTKEGTAKDKVTVALVSNSLVLQAGATEQLALTVEANELVEPSTDGSDVLTLVLSAAEG